METGELACEKRAVRPKGLVHQLRREGRIPAVLYGPTTAPMPLSVDRVQLGTTMSAAHVRLIRLKSSTPELDGRHVIFREIQRAPVSGEILHADFYEVDLNRAIRVAVPLKFVGLAAGVGDGGILQPLVRVVEVECLPLEIPEAIEVDVSALGIHDVIHLSAIRFAANIKPIFDSDYAVVSVLPPTVAEAPVAAAAAAEEAVPVEGAVAEAGAAAAGAPAAEAAKEGGAAAGATGGQKKAEPAAKK